MNNSERKLDTFNLYATLVLYATGKKMRNQCQLNHYLETLHSLVPSFLSLAPLIETFRGLGKERDGHVVPVRVQI